MYTSFQHVKHINTTPGHTMSLFNLRFRSIFAEIVCAFRNTSICACTSGGGCRNHGSVSHSACTIMLLPGELLCHETTDQCSRIGPIAMAHAISVNRIKAVLSFIEHSRLRRSDMHIVVIPFVVCHRCRVICIHIQRRRFRQSRSPPPKRNRATSFFVALL